MTLYKNFLTLSLLTLGLVPLHSAVLTSIPGPDAQGGMLMPMVSLNEGTKTLSVMFDPYTPPRLAPLTVWSPRNSFDPADAWYSLLNPTPGGQGALFSNRFGFMSMSVTLPTNLSLGIRLTSISSPAMESWNYVDGSSFFDEVFTGSGDHVLWDGGMWHNYFTLPANAAAGIYAATFEVFVANAAFTDNGTGYADYSSLALNAAPDTSYNTVEINYTWQVVPEPSTSLLLVGAAIGFALLKRRRNRLQKA